MKTASASLYDRRPGLSPTDGVPAGLEYLKAKCAQEAQALLDYFDLNYVNGAYRLAQPQPITLKMIHHQCEFDVTRRAMSQPLGTSICLNFATKVEQTTSARVGTTRSSGW